MTSIHDNPRSTRPADARRGRGLPGRWRAVGMTLVEMLVAISVLAVMILAVSSILVQTQRFISAAQENRRSHAMAFTIARIIRRDLRRVSKDGFLCVTSGAGGGSMLIFSTAGPASGISESTKGDGSIVCYGQQSTTTGTKYLWRPEYICNCTTGAPSTAIEGERINVNFSTIQICAGSSADANSPFTLQALADKVASTTPGDMKLPPTTATQLKNLWQVLVTNVEDVRISWTYGDKSGSNLNWQTSPMLWTHQNQTDWTLQNTTGWPKAIRITFTIKDPSMPKELRGTGHPYEVICIVGA
jgi:prepilin-type N-terminal cleavage/methylation domain-containing protein